MALEVIEADWPAPPNVRAMMTTRLGGASTGAFASLNLGAHVGDLPAAVAENRRRLRARLPGEPLWLDQVHGTRVAAMESAIEAEQADAVTVRTPGCVCAIMTADCLPVVLCDRAGTVVAAAHAGWRGLCEGVLENAVAAMRRPPSALMAWMGAAIGPSAFEVGGEVRAAFMTHDARAAKAFTASRNAEKWLCDLYMLATQRLQACGVSALFGGGSCTYSEPDRFFSYRRDGVSGRMATCVWMTGNPA